MKLNKAFMAVAIVVATTNLSACVTRHDINAGIGKAKHYNTLRKNFNIAGVKVKPKKYKMDGGKWYGLKLKKRF
mgnify:CR=1 FL=1